jgi:sialate O-acetylesterase
MRAALILAAAAGAAATSCHVSNVLGTHMVLQRDRPANVWGWANAGVAVTVSLNGAKLPAATAGADGKWLVALPAQPATTTPSTLSFACSDGTAPADITDVLFGDVHICRCVIRMHARTRAPAPGRERALMRSRRVRPACCAPKRA